MNICLAHSSATGGSGSGRYILDVARRFAEDSHEVTLYCHECDDAFLTTPRIEVVRLPRPSGRLGTWRFGHVSQLKTLRRELTPLLRRRECDLLLGSDLLFLEPIKRFYGRSLPFIYTPLSMIAPIEIQSYELGGLPAFLGVALYTRLQRWALDECDRVARFTESAVRALERYYHVDLQKKKLVSVYVSREFETAGPADDGPDGPIVFERPEPRELLWVGRLVKSKNVAFLIRAAAQLKSTNWILNICNDGPEREALQQLASSLGIAERVRFLGHVADLAAVYRRASLLLTGSVLEQYSLTIMEGYAFGVPCVALRPDWKTIFNSVEDQIADGVTGYLVDSEPQMAARVDELLADDDRRRQMARRAFERKQAGFSFEAFYDDLRGAVAALRPAAVS